MPTRYAVAVEQFSNNESLFLAFANYQSDTGDKNTDSFIYKLDDSIRKFSLNQTIDTNGAYDIEYFTIADKHYLAVANHYNGTTNQLNSVIYQWNGHQFVALQNIPTNGATTFNFFQILKELFLAVANKYGNVLVFYKWKDNHFEKFQGMGTWGFGFASTAFKINNETFTAIAN